MLQSKLKILKLAQQLEIKPTTIQKIDDPEINSFGVNLFFEKRGFNSSSYFR